MQFLFVFIFDYFSKTEAAPGGMKLLSSAVMSSSINNVTSTNKRSFVPTNPDLVRRCKLGTAEDGAAHSAAEPTLKELKQITAVLTVCV